MSRKWYCIISLTLICIGTSSSVHFKLWCFRRNLSASLPYKAYLAIRWFPPFEKGQIVGIDHPHLEASLGKIIGGKPGDLISIHNQMLFINDVEIGPIQSVSKSGRFYQPIAEGVIPEGNYFVYGSHPESYDSRYEAFGLVKEEWIKEVLWPIL